MTKHTHHWPFQVPRANVTSNYSPKTIPRRRPRNTMLSFRENTVSYFFSLIFSFVSFWLGIFCLTFWYFLYFLIWKFSLHFDLVFFVSSWFGASWLHSFLFFFILVIFSCFCSLQSYFFVLSDVSFNSDLVFLLHYEIVFVSCFFSSIYADWIFSNNSNLVFSWHSDFFKILIRSFFDTF